VKFMADTGKELNVQEFSAFEAIRIKESPP
jgi:hypothetical protein